MKSVGHSISLIVIIADFVEIVQGMVPFALYPKPYTMIKYGNQ